MYTVDLSPGNAALLKKNYSQRQSFQPGHEEGALKFYSPIAPFLLRLHHPRKQNAIDVSAGDNAVADG